jgi:hypothetical protein
MAHAASVKLETRCWCCGKMMKLLPPSTIWSVNYKTLVKPSLWLVALRVGNVHVVCDAVVMLVRLIARSKRPRAGGVLIRFAVAMPASKESEWMTGQVFSVSGGFCMAG